MQPLNHPDAASGRPREPLCFITCGSVDDGKSTLIGRLLYDSRALMVDQLRGLARSEFAGTAADGLDLALATDGLEAEREQGITIDVAWRYFATPRRKFMIADTPGHAQYTRNMVTGATHAQAAVLLVDVTKLDVKAPSLVLLEQTRRHAALVRLLGIPHVLVAVNKMDAVGFDPAVHTRVCEAFARLAEALGIRRWQALPVSALTGEGVTRARPAHAGFKGPTLLEALEALEALEPPPTAAASVPGDDGAAWLAVAWSLRDAASDGARWYCGRLDEGTLAVGDTLRVLPGGAVAEVGALRVAGRSVTEARTGDAVAVRLDRPLDVARGDWLTTAGRPRLDAQAEATLAWLHPEPALPGRPLLLRHGTRWLPARIARLEARLDLAQAAWDADASDLAGNDIGAVTLDLAEAIPLAADPRRARGRFMLVDPQTHATLAAGVFGRPFADTLASAGRLRREWAG